MKKIYRIKDKRTGQYVSLGYRPKSTWTVFPSAAIINSYHIDNPDNFQVDVFETQLVGSLTLDRKEIV